ncbi:quinone oxidoreductase [Gossypium arboreum]|uniref:Quinone oxidoreductase n=1 Tax=Gossypium arboreum TaxID=29729 RepID=A0A0B0NFY8_GOSAR|nr:quinone oxidoreductase [Gossypium arboreum]
MYCQSRVIRSDTQDKISSQLDFIGGILVFQSIDSFAIRLRKCLGSSTNISCLSILQSGYAIPLNIS